MSRLLLDMNMAREEAPITDESARRRSTAKLDLHPAAAILLERLAAAAQRAERELLAQPLTDPTRFGIKDDRDSSEYVTPCSYPSKSTAKLLSIRAGLAGASKLRFDYDANQPPVTRIPAHLRILVAHNLDLWDRVLLARVNRAFRSALLSEPTLWNRVSVPRRNSHRTRAYWRCAKRIISRSYESLGHCIPPIHIRSTQFLDLSPEADYMHNTLGDLLRIASTASYIFYPVRSLFGNDTAWWKQEVLLWRLICEEAPSLERLSLRAFSPDDGLKAVLPTNFLGHSSGSLRSLNLDCVLLQDQVIYPAFRGLREFCYSAESSVVQTVIGSALLQQTLDSMPKLELFGIAHVVFVTDSPKPTARHGCLREVVGEYIEDGLEDLILFFKHIEKVRYHKCLTGRMDLYDQWPEGNIGLVMDLLYVIVRPETTDPAYTFSIAQNAQWTGEGIRTHSIDIASAHVWRIVSLTMKDVEWDAARQLPPLPRLRSLAIVISTCYLQNLDLTELLWGGIIVQDEAPPWRTALENLQEVRLYSSAQYTSSKSSPSFLGDSQWPPPCTHVCCRGDGCLIFLRDVSDFVRSLQLPGSRRLSRLSLYGFNSFGDLEPGLELCELLKLVDNVERGDDSKRDELITCQGNMGLEDPFSDTRLAREIHSIFDGMSLPGGDF